MKSKILVLALIFATLTSARAEDALKPPGALRYKMTVNVETPDGIKTGFAVRDANAIMTPKNADPKKRTPKGEFEGEAVTIDLGKQGLIFALVDHSTGFGLTAEEMRLLPAEDQLKPGLKIPVPEKAYPSFARFDDLNDPLSRKGVLQTDELKIKDVTIEITDAPVTQELDKHLPWLTCTIKWPAEFVNQAKHGRPLFHLYRYLNPEEYEGVRNIRSQRLKGMPDTCDAFWKKMYESFSTREDLPPVKDCAGDEACNPFDTPENRALLEKKK